MFKVLEIDRENCSATLVAGDRSLGRIDGLAIEAQIKCPTGYLVITSDDTPYEEVLHFILLNDAMERIDQLDLGKVYQAGMLRQLYLGDDYLEFSFFGEDRWRLSVLGTPTVWIPRLLSGVSYPTGWRRRHHLKLERLNGGQRRHQDSRVPRN